MNTSDLEYICEVSGRDRISKTEKIQSLWSGYGEIVRIRFKNTKSPPVVVKHIRFPAGDTGISHERKLKSYKVECNFYKNWSHFCHKRIRIPECFGMRIKDDEILIVLEDLSHTSFPLRKHNINREEFKYCLRWLATFHSLFIGKEPEELWQQGTYWHLATRPEEWEQLNDIPLKKAAHLIDKRLNNTRYKTILHGDAKLANFCFSSDLREVAALDFQYTGGGCGMKDLVYFAGSAMSERQCMNRENEILDLYFTFLREELRRSENNLNCNDLEKEWRSLYPFAWADFHRFLKGWSPGYYPQDLYSEQVCQKVISLLKKRTAAGTITTKPGRSRH